MSDSWISDLPQPAKVVLLILIILSIIGSMYRLLSWVQDKTERSGQSRLEEIFVDCKLRRNQVQRELERERDAEWGGNPRVVVPRIQRPQYAAASYPPK